MGGTDLQTVRKKPDNDFSFGVVPVSDRRSFWGVGFVMLGFTFFSASMSVGAKLGIGLDAGGFAAAVTVGGLILACFTGVLAYVGAATGMGVDELARHSFGTYGSFLPSFLIAFTQMGWFGVGVAMFALPTADVLGISPIPIVLVAGGLMTASAYYGIRAIEIVSFISVPLISVLGTYSMITAAAAGGGLSHVFASGSDMSVLTGVGLVVGSFISGGSATPNFTRFAKTPKSAVITTVIAFLVGNTLMFSFGAVGGAFTGKDDIFYVMIAQGLALPALIVLGTNIWTTNNNALYTTGLGFANITKYPKKPLVIVAGVVGTLCSLWLYRNFVGWLSFLNATLPPIGTVLAADYFACRRTYALRENTAVVGRSIFAVVCGTAAGWMVPLGIASLNAVAATLAGYAVWTVLTRGAAGSGRRAVVTCCVPQSSPEVPEFGEAGFGQNAQDGRRTARAQREAGK